MINLILHLMRVVMLLLPLVVLTGCGGGGGDTQSNNGAASDSVPVAPARSTLSFDRTKIFRITWTDVSDATYYRVLENSDGSSGYTQVSNDIPVGTQSYDYALDVALYNRLNASYILQSCNARGCNDDFPVFVSGSLSSATGYIRPSNPARDAFFGSVISLSSDGDTMAVSARGENSSNGSGVVYVFSRDAAGRWSQQSRIAPVNSSSSGFGYGIGLSGNGDTLAIGESANDSVHLFTRTNNTWSLSSSIQSPLGSDSFGRSVCLSGDGMTLAVGAPADDSSTMGVDSTADTSATNSGAVYIYVDDGTGAWSQAAYIKAVVETESGAGFGQSISLSRDGRGLAVGAPGKDFVVSSVVQLIDIGAVYTYYRDFSTNNWNSAEYLTATVPNGSGPAHGARDYFGTSVSLYSPVPTIYTLAVGAPDEDGSSRNLVSSLPDDVGDNVGAVYVYRVSAARSTGFLNASIADYIKPSNPDNGDRFGASVSLSYESGSGPVLAIGASGEDGLATGINGIPSNDTESSGAVYIFRNNEINRWNQDAYIKGLFTQEENFYFGDMVAISDDASTLVVSATGDSAVLGGINNFSRAFSISAGNYGSVFVY